MLLNSCYSRVAIHEASHAIATLELGGKVDSIIINGDESYIKARCICYHLENYKNNIIFAAGMAGEKIIFNEQEYNLHNSELDIENIIKSTGYKNLNQFLHEAEYILQSNQQLIINLAENLEEKRHLSREEVLEIYNGNK